MPSKQFRFQVALSFPGEHRARVEKIAGILADRLGSSNVLYDEWYRAEFARPNLNVYLPTLYLEQSLLLVFFLCGAYVEKEWCGLEWRAGLDLLKRKEDHRLMLLRLDRADIPGLYSIDGYIDISVMPEEDIARHILKRVTTEIDKAVSTLRDHARPDILNRCGTIRILTMEQPIELGGIYTDVNILERRPANLRKTRNQLVEEAGLDSFARFGISSPAIKRVAGLTALEDHQRIVIYGKPGAGKTTFLKRLAIECTNGSFRAELVPVFVTLRDFAESSDASLSLGSYIQRQWGENANSQAILREGRALILLDGLDEVRDQDFVRVRTTIESFTTEFNRCCIVLTCRIAAREYAFDRFTEVEMADFNKAQIQTFAARWFSVQGEKKKARAFIAKLEANGPVFELASSPLLLTLLCLVFQERNDFDGTRAELYGEGIDVLLRKWDAKRGVERDRPYGLSITNLESLLSEIAYSRFMASEYFFTQGSLEKQIEGFFKERKLLRATEELLPSRVLNSIESHLGLLVQRAVRVYSFSHLTFQEYLSAQRVARKTTLLAEIGPYVGDRRWREVWLLLVTMLDEDYIIREIKKYVDMLVEKEPEIQVCLVWCRSKAARCVGHTLPALRTFFFGLDCILDRALELARTTDSDRAFDRALVHDLDRALALAAAFDPSLAHTSSGSLDTDLKLDCALAVSLSLARAVNQAATRPLNFDDFTLIIFHNAVGNLARALTRSLDRAEDVARVAAPAMVPELRMLRAAVPSVPDRKQWREKWTTWHLEFRSATVRHRDIGHDWNFSDRQRSLLNDYYRANLLEIDCKNVASGLTNKTREYLESTILLPWNELPRAKET